MGRQGWLFNVVVLSLFRQGKQAGWLRLRSLCIINSVHLLIGFAGVTWFCLGDGWTLLLRSLEVCALLFRSSGVHHQANAWEPPGRPGWWYAPSPCSKQRANLIDSHQGAISSQLVCLPWPTNVHKTQGKRIETEHLGIKVQVTNWVHGTEKAWVRVYAGRSVLWCHSDLRRSGEDPVHPQVDGDDRCYGVRSVRTLINLGRRFFAIYISGNTVWRW